MLPPSQEKFEYLIE